MQIPKGGLIGKAVGVARRVQAMSIPSHAANAGYFIVLSVFPALVLVLSLLRYTSLDARDLLDLLSDFLPAALLPAAAICVGGYYLYEALITGNGIAPLAGIPGYITQSVLSSVVFVVLGAALDNLRIKDFFQNGGR